MALFTDYASLQTEIGNWLERSGTTPVTSNVTTWIQLAESEINVELQGIRKTRTSTTSLTGSIGSRVLALTSLTDFLTAIALVRTTDSSEVRMRKYAGGTIPRRTQNGYPLAWAVTGDNIVLDAPCDKAHTFEFWYHTKFDIATDDTNWLLSNYPNIYLFKSLKHAAVFFKDAQGAQGYDAIAETDIAKLKAAESKNNDAILTVDPALVGGGGYDITSDEVA